MEAILTGAETQSAAPAQAPSTQPETSGATVGGFANVNLPTGDQTNDAQNATPQEAPQGANQATQNNTASDGVIGQKEQAQEKPNTNVPEKYADFSYKDMTLDPDAQVGFGALCRDLGFSQAQGQTVVNAIGDYITEQTTKTYQAWAEQSRNDPEIGGRNLATTQRYANKALSSFFSPKAQELMQQMGLFNNPDFIRGMRKVGEAISNDSPRELIGGNSQASKALRENPLKAMYEKYNDNHVL